LPGKSDWPPLRGSEKIERKAAPSKRPPCGARIVAEQAPPQTSAWPGFFLPLVFPPRVAPGRLPKQGEVYPATVGVFSSGPPAGWATATARLIFRRCPVGLSGNEQNLTGKARKNGGARSAGSFRAQANRTDKQVVQDKANHRSGTGRTDQHIIGNIRGFLLAPKGAAAS